MGISIGHNKVAKLKKELELYPIMRRKYKITTDSSHNNKATLIDLSTRKVISYTISETMEADMITNIIKSGLKKGEIPKGAIFHSDRGVQYTSNKVKELLKELNINQSMSP
jgi:transposase InsO family protein